MLPKKPIQHLGKLLRLVGLRHKQVRSKKAGDEKISLLFVGAG